MITPQFWVDTMRKVLGKTPIIFFCKASVMGEDKAAGRRATQAYLSSTSRSPTTENAVSPHNRGLTFFFVVSLLFFVSACERKVEKGKYQFFYELHDSIPYDSFDDSPVTADGKTLREPISGTIARNHMPYHYAKTPQDAERAGKELQNPLPKSPQNLVRGKELYETFCMVCHGPTGKGDGSVIPKFPPPQPFSSDYMRQLPAGRIFHVMTVGSFIMGSYASQISREDRWKIVHYVQHILQNGKEIEE